MSLHCNPPRSSRSSGISPSNLESEWFPNIKNPDSIVHQQINTLNCDAYPFEVFARADDLLMFMAFANKGKKCRHHSVLPEPAQSGNPMYLSKQEGAVRNSLLMGSETRRRREVEGDWSKGAARRCWGGKGRRRAEGEQSRLLGSRGGLLTMRELCKAPVWG